MDASDETDRMEAQADADARRVIEPEFGRLVDVPALQAMMDDFNALTSIPLALIDRAGIVVVGSGWQDVCTGFHRVNPESCAHCIESDTVLTADIPAGESRLYRCKNGMWDAAMPVVIDGETVANVFTGQFFFADERIDEKFFIAQAQRYGFDEAEYLEAVKAVPRLAREDVQTGLRFLTELSNMLSQLSFGNLELARLAAERESLLTREQARNTQLRTLADIDELLASSLAVADVIDRALESAEKHLGVAASSVWVLGEDQRLRIVGHRGFPDVFLTDFGAGVDIDGAFPVAQAAKSLSPVLFEGASEGEIHRPVRDAYASYGIELCSLAAVPLVARGVVIGALTLAWDSDLHFDSDQMTFISTLASRFSNAIENARLFEERDRQATFAVALNRINSVVHGVLDTAEIVRRVIAKMTTALDVDASMVQLKRDGHWEIAFGSGVLADVGPQRLEGEDSRLPALIEQTGQPLVIQDVLSDEQTRGTVVGRSGVRSLLGVPLAVRGEVIGVLFTARTRDRGDFPLHEVDFAVKVASTVSLALENARLYEAEHRIANRLQEALLLLPDRLPGLEFAHVYRSATVSTRVGGDFYDLFELDHDLVGVTIGDVAGKGLEAAALTSLVKNAIRVHAYEKGARPAEILDLTNDAVYRSTNTEAFVTVFFGILNCRSGLLKYANAGHPTAGIIGADGTVEKLRATSPLVGAFDSVTFDAWETRLGMGGSLFLHTDGLTEARRGAEFFGEERLFGLLSSLKDDSPAEMIDGVLSNVLKFAGGRLSDDLAMLSLRRVQAED